MTCGPATRLRSRRRSWWPALPSTATPEPPPTPWLRSCAQTFKISKLKELYNDLSDDEKEILTDACKICVVRNVPVRLVKGEVSNMKITTIDDMKAATALIMEDIKC